jgi:hypothetical protein
MADLEGFGERLKVEGYGEEVFNGGASFRIIAMDQSFTF